MAVSHPKYSPPHADISQWLGPINTECLHLAKTILLFTNSINPLYLYFITHALAIFTTSFFIAFLKPHFQNCNRYWIVQCLSDRIYIFTIGLANQCNAYFVSYLQQFLSTFWMCELCNYFLKLYNTNNNQGLYLCYVVKIHLQLKSFVFEKSNWFFFCSIRYCFPYLNDY